MLPDPLPLARNSPLDLACTVVLKAVSHPALDDIRIDDNLFAIGRNEAPFATYDAAIVGDLSRRHARIFSEFGAVYIADLDSKNGTTVNGVAVKQKPMRLQEGDEVCFARTLSFRVQLGARATAPTRAARLLSLTLTPEQGDLGLQPIVIARFPFLVSKTDEVFARYKEKFPHQINYISRRHAHVFLKNGRPFVEDLGSTNGTFVGGRRLDEHAVALQDGDLLAFGGHQLTYRVSLQQETVSEPTATRLSLVASNGAPAAGDGDKTTFLAAADSFLDIFCIDRSPQEEDELNKETQPPGTEAGSETAPRGKRHKAAVFLSELREAFAGAEPRRSKRIFRWGGALAAAVAVLAVALYLLGSPVRDVKALLTEGDYAQAALTARQALAEQPDNRELQALGSEALLKAHGPDWVERIKGGDFVGAAAAIARMKELAADNAEARPLVGELERIGNLEKFVAGRGKDDGLIQIYADEETIATLLKEWDNDAQKHQRIATAIAAQVPAFKDTYAEALSHLRKLQSDDSVYLAAIERLKTAIATELKRDRPAALDAIFKEYAERYPRLGGIDRLRQDLSQYLELDNAAGAGKLGALVAAMDRVKFATPPFQEKLRSVAAAGRLPSAQLLAQYRTVVAQAWREGNSQQAIDSLQKLATGRWADAAAGEAEHKKAVAGQFAELQKARGSKAYEERLLNFYGLLDPDEDVYFVHAIEADLAAIKDQAIKRAQELLNRAQASWRQYRDNGGIDGAQRQEATISTAFKSQAGLLAEAHAAAEQGAHFHTQLKVDFPPPWPGLQQEIKAEGEQQRSALLDLRNVLEPGLLKTKLALIGGRHGDERQSP